ncbi:MAG TPA: phospholipid carrier-dependent glycosyltransferase [Candidatus Moranbacteria bacterium]|nr:phospholipid carrier-dependent glycosyltransferase [Candidatus Moranbacteria bacterium]
MKNKLVPLFFFIIIIASFLLRTYQFDDWLYFKMDQARDAFLIDNIVENGPGYMPLLGARAGATEVDQGFLRLGPIFYYFQYISTLIFNSSQPPVLAYPDLFFSIAAIILLFFFARLYFSRKYSLMITAMYAFSFIIIQYSRFAWNPNSLQFFLLLSFYGLLKFFREQNEKKKYLWLILWILGIVIGSQLHFFGFFGLVGISGLFVLFKMEFWKKEKIFSYFKKENIVKFSKYVAAAFFVFILLYMPVIISDIKENGQNTKNFITALSSKPESKPFIEKISKNISENLNYYCLITTSQCYGEENNKENFAMFLTTIILISGVIILLRALRKEKNDSRKDFLALLLIWISVYFILMIPVSFQLRPRFFIVVFAVPFILLGMIYEYLEEKIGYKKAVWTGIVVSSLIIVWNSYGTYAWFREQANSQKETVEIRRSLILKAKDGVLLWHLQSVADWMYAHHEKGKTLYYYVKPEHVRPIDYLLYKKRDKDLVYETMKINDDPNAEYFAITPTKNGTEPVIKKFGDNITVIEQKEFGQLMVSKIMINDRNISADFRFNRPKTKTDRLFWKDVFNKKDRDDNLYNITGEE